MNSILVISAHPDSEILGCGGNIAWHKDAGDTFNVLTIAEGLTSRNTIRYRSKLSKDFSDLANCAEKAKKNLGVDNLESLNSPNSRLDSIDLLELIKVVNHQARFIGSQLGVEAVEPFTLMRSIV